jgi:hypothetical protein
MATLREVVALVRQCAEQAGDAAFNDQMTKCVEEAIRKRWAGERIYVVPWNSRKDPGRAESILKASRFLPTRVVAERFGVTRHRVSQIIKASQRSKKE